MRKVCCYLCRGPDIVPVRSIFLKMYEERAKSFLYTSIGFLEHAAKIENKMLNLEE